VRADAFQLTFCFLSRQYELPILPAQEGVLLHNHRLSGYGAVPDPEDKRDFLYTPPAGLGQLSGRVDLRKICPGVHEQGQSPTCTGFAISAAFQVQQRRQKLEDFWPSPLFIYYTERAMLRAQHQRGGANLRAGLKAVAKHGVCPEKMWPYSQKMSVLRIKPPQSAYEFAAQHKILCYQRLQQGSRSTTEFLNLLKSRLKEGSPFLFAFKVYKSFEADPDLKSGVLPIPQPHEDFITWHAVLAVGYDDERKQLLVRNSWGPGWGQKGYFRMPYEFIVRKEMTADFWTISEVTPKTSG
jgi:C1A family cysteine protease